MRRAALAAALLLAGCGPGTAEQEGAERAVGRAASTDRVECTSRSRIWFSDGPPAKVLICAAHVSAGFCDRYRVDREGNSYRVHVLERQASCVLPAG